MLEIARRLENAGGAVKKQSRLTSAPQSLAHACLATSGPLVTTAVDAAAVDRAPILNVLARDCRQSPAVGVKLGDNGEGLARVDGLARTPEVALSACVRVVATTSLVAIVSYDR